MKVKELLTDESKWTKGEFARTAEGMCCGSLSSFAVRWCLDGAVDHCYRGNGDGVIYSEVREKVKKEIGGSVWDWNDNKERTFEDVKALIEKLDI